MVCQHHIYHASFIAHFDHTLGTTSYYSVLSDHLVNLIKNQRAIVYTDFVKDVAPLAISLSEKGINSCGYHGKNMSSHDKVKTVENWSPDDSNIQVSTIN